MNWDRIEGEWKQFKGLVKEKWGKLTDSDFEVIAGKKDQLIGKLPDGGIAGFQDKVQVDPSEDGLYTPGSERRVFHTGPLKFGVVICHEGWRYLETVRWAAQRGAHIVFHPHYHAFQPGNHVPTTFTDPANTFHEKAMLCRAAENTCWFASVNCASVGSGTTSAIVRPDGTLLCYQPYGKQGVLVADIDIAAATGLLAARCKYGYTPAVAAVRAAAD